MFLICFIFFYDRKFDLLAFISKKFLFFFFSAADGKPPANNFQV